MTYDVATVWSTRHALGLTVVKNGSIIKHSVSIQQLLRSYGLEIIIDISLTKYKIIVVM